MIGGATDREFCRSLLNGQPFPGFPFSDPNWLGFIFNRDLHNAAGVSRELFEALITPADASVAFEFTFVPALRPLEGVFDFPIAQLSDWEGYLNLIASLPFCPEYYLLRTDGAVILWFDPDAVVVGGTPDVMTSAASHLGGMEALTRQSAEEFGVSLSDANSEIATYIRNLAGRERDAGGPPSSIRS